MRLQAAAFQRRQRLLGAAERLALRPLNDHGESSGLEPQQDKA